MRLGDGRESYGGSRLDSDRPRASPPLICNWIIFSEIGCHLSSKEVQESVTLWVEGMQTHSTDVKYLPVAFR